MNNLENTHCPICGEELYKTINILGTTKTIKISCSCERAKEAEYIKLMKENHEKEKMENLKKLCFPKNNYSSCSFNSVFQPDYYKLLLKYYENFEELKNNNMGILLYGASGTGKTYASCALLNLLIQKYYKAKFFSYNYIINLLTGMLQGKTDFLDSLLKYDIILIDDFACRKHTDFLIDLEFDIINTIYENNIVLIITTNHNLDFFSKPKLLGEKRINMRILERCYPICTDSIKNIRNQLINENFNNTKKILYD